MLGRSHWLDGSQRILQTSHGDGRQNLPERFAIFFIFFRIPNFAILTSAQGRREHNHSSHCVCNQESGTELRTVSQLIDHLAVVYAEHGCHFNHFLTSHVNSNSYMRCIIAQGPSQSSRTSHLCIPVRPTHAPAECVSNVPRAFNDKLDNKRKNEGEYLWYRI
jgi:hypothetical protein